MDEARSDLNLQERKFWWARFFNGVQWGIVILVLITVAGIFVPRMLTPGGKPGFGGEVQAMRELTTAMHEFSRLYGSFPNDRTALQVAEKFPNVVGLKQPSSADDYFKQLLVTGCLDEEILRAAKKRNVKLTYVVWQEHVPTEASAPVLVTPLVQGEKQFDRKYASKHTGSKAIQATVDQAVRTLKITDEGGAVVHRTHFFSEDLPWWSEQEWKLAWAE